MIGSKFEPHEIRAEIARDEMATAYRAYQPVVDYEVAINLIQQNLISDATSAHRFDSAAILCSGSDHGARWERFYARKDVSDV